MTAARNLRLFTLYQACSLEGVCHGIYLLWLTAEKGVSPLAAALVLAGGVAERAGYDAAWALELALSCVGLVIAFAMREPPPAPAPADLEKAPTDRPGASSSWRDLIERVPWAVVVPAAVASALASSGEL